MTFRALLFLSLVLALFSSASEQAGAQELNITKSIQQLVGEDYRYAIDFLFFTRLAAGEFRFSESGQVNVYKAELIGRTSRIASWLIGERTQTYTSLMELTPDGSLRSIEHVARIDKLRWGMRRNWGRLHRYDYEQGKIFAEKSNGGVPRSKKEHEIPAGQQPVDMLTAFCNLRTGLYGPLVRGAHFLIPTYSDDGFAEIEVNVLTVEQQAEYDYFPSSGQLVQAKIDPKIFENSGNLYIWFNNAGVPERGIVENMIGKGDIMVYLDEENL